MTEVTKTILEQLGGKMFILMTGAKNFSYDEDSLSFKIGRNKTKCNFVKIQYNYNEDLYNMAFFCLSKSFNLKELEKHEGVYWDDLQRLFTEYTGMYTSL